jgi:hypothetical protein
LLLQAEGIPGFVNAALIGTYTPFFSDSPIVEESWLSCTPIEETISGSSARAKRREPKGVNMAKPNNEANGMRKEYDFSGGIRGKYAKRFAQGCNVVVLEPDVARLYPDAEAVNRALRALAEVAPRSVRRKKRG